MRRKFNWTDKQLDKLKKVQEILADLEKYKPLTLRQIFYQLVAREYIQNTKSQYTLLSNLLKHARLDGYISWDDIEDRVRRFEDLSGWPGPDDFISAHLKRFLSGYSRDLLQTQEKYIEIWIEKDALSALFVRAAEPYTVPVVVCRGFSSVSFLNDFKERISWHEDRRPVMLYFGDFDPSGVVMLEAMEETLRDEFKIPDIEFKRIALLKEDIEKYRLPHNPDAIKEHDTRKDKHVEKYGELAVELDALRPDILIDRIETAIRAELDLDAFQDETEKQQDDLDLLKRKKKEILAFFEQ